MSRVSYKGQPVPRRVVAITYPSGNPLEPQFYSMQPYEDQSGRASTRVVYFAMPVDTIGMTFWFEPKDW